MIGIVEINIMEINIKLLCCYISGLISKFLEKILNMMLFKMSI